MLAGFVRRARGGPSLAETHRRRCAHLRRGLLHSAAQTAFCSSSSGSSRPPEVVRIPRPFSLNPTERRVVDFFVRLQRDNPGPGGLDGLEYRMAGGWVRDKLLGCPELLQSLGGGRDGRRLPRPPPVVDPEHPGDIDIALSNMTGAQLLPFVEAAQARSAEHQAAAKHTFVVKANPEQSKHLETVQVRIHGYPVDLVNLRREDYAEDSRIPVMQIGTPVEDAYRRDFTLNSLFYHLQRDEVEDWLGGRGLRDLALGELHTPTQPASITLLDDPLRSLRALRFSVRFGFQLGPELLAAMRLPQVVADLRLKVSRGRIRKELWPMLQHCRRPEEEEEAPDQAGKADVAEVDTPGRGGNTSRCAASGLAAAAGDPRPLPASSGVSSGPGVGPIEWIGRLGMHHVIFPPLAGARRHPRGAPGKPDEPEWNSQDWERGSRASAGYRRLLYQLRFPSPELRRQLEALELPEATCRFLRLLRPSDATLPVTAEPLNALHLLRTAFEEAAETSLAGAGAQPCQWSTAQTIGELACLYLPGLARAAAWEGWAIAGEADESIPFPALARTASPQGVVAVAEDRDNGSNGSNDGNAGGEDNAGDGGDGLTEASINRQPHVALPNPVRLGSVPAASGAGLWQRILVRDKLVLSSGEFGVWRPTVLGGCAAHQILDAPEPCSVHPASAATVEVAGAAEMPLHPSLEPFRSQIWRANQVASMLRLTGPELALPSLLAAVLVRQADLCSSAARFVPDPLGVATELCRFLAEHEAAAESVFRALHPPASQPREQALSQWVVRHSQLGARGRWLGFFMDALVLGQVYGPCALHRLDRFLAGCERELPMGRQIAPRPSPEAIAAARSRWEALLPEVIDPACQVLPQTREFWLRKLEDVLEPLVADPLQG